MTKTYLHPAGSVPMPDQEWVSDVTNLAVNKFKWNGSTISPHVDFNVYPSTPYHGIKVNQAAPEYPWFDLLSPVHVDNESASNKPLFDTYIDGIKQYKFALNDRIYADFHMPHDYVPGSTVYIHAHWSHTSDLVVSGGVTWTFDISYSKGHNQMAFSGPLVLPVTQAASTIARQHLIAEVPLSAVGGAGGLIDSALLEPDGIFLVRVTLTGNNMSAVTDPFLHFVDLHYQSTGIGTLNKAPNFYGTT